MKSVLALGTALALAIAAPASATLITYTFTGNVTASLDGTDYPAAPSVFTAIGDTDTLAEVSPGSGLFAVNLSSFTATSGGMGYSFTGTSQFRFIPDSGIAGIVLEGNEVPFQFIGVGNYDGVSDFATTSVTYQGSFGTFATSVGSVAILGITDLTFSADVEDAAAAVPEPATWGMMLLGFGMVGAGMRRRKSTLVAA